MAEQKICRVRTEAIALQIGAIAGVKAQAARRIR
jgi:hypothetical protein